MKFLLPSKPSAKTITIKPSQYFNDDDNDENSNEPKILRVIAPIENEWSPQMNFNLNLQEISNNSESVSLKKLKEDLERLPEDQGFEEFKEVAVEGFGAALLAGYGWEEGRSIGKNAIKDVKVVQFKNRIYRQGLGCPTL